MRRTVLVTGGAGFIGSNLVRVLLAERPNWRIIVLDALTYAGDLENLEGLLPDPSGRLSFVQGSVGDSGLVEQLLADNALDAVAHLAAETHVDRSIAGPEAFVETNVLGTFRLLEQTRRDWERRGKPDGFRFLQVSTDEVYGSLGPEGRSSEGSPYAPSSPYSASKASADHFARAYHQTYGLPILVTACSNNFGPFQHEEKLIPHMIARAVRGDSLPVYGDGGNVRDWLYVRDHCDALLRVLEAGVPGETYNIGGGTELTNLDVVRQLGELVDTHLKKRPGETAGRISFVPDRPGHDRRYALDASKVRRELGWQPRHPFGAALRETVRWYLDRLAPS